MIRGCKEFMLEFIKHPELIRKIKRYKSDDLVCDVMTFGAYKSRKQNSLFHGLLSCFWDSHCSSFSDPEELRDYYKKLAGLRYTTESMVGGVRTIATVDKSWADVKKSDATRAIQCLMHDMDQAGVLGSHKGKKYEEILRGIGEWFDF